MKYLSLILLITLRAIAAEVTLAWDANPEPDIISYKINYGKTAELGQTKIVEGITTTIDLEKGTWYFAAQAQNSKGLDSPQSPVISYTINAPNSKGWIIKDISSEEPDGWDSFLAIDGKTDTFWHTVWKEGKEQKPLPHWIEIDMNSVETINSFSHTPRQDQYNNTIGKYEFYTSLDAITWDKVSEGEFLAGKQTTNVSFPLKKARYFKLVGLSELGGGQSMSIAEISVNIIHDVILPSAPKKLRVVEIQTSNNLIDWESIAFIPLKDSSLKKFVRAGITEINTVP
jgi:hypothetical protein